MVWTTAASSLFNKFREAYSGVLILDATPRELFDLWTSMRHIIDENNARERSGFDSEQTPPYLWMIVDLAVFAVADNCKCPH